jgi:hypothetical protein
MKEQIYLFMFMYLFCMDMKRHNFEIWNKLLGTIWEHINKREKKRVEGWELATHNSNNTTPLDAKI